MPNKFQTNQIQQPVDAPVDTFESYERKEFFEFLEEQIIHTQNLLNEGLWDSISSGIGSAIRGVNSAVISPTYNYIGGKAKELVSGIANSAVGETLSGLKGIQTPTGNVSYDEVAQRRLNAEKIRDERANEAKLRGLRGDVKGEGIKSASDLRRDNTAGDFATTDKRASEVIGTKGDKDTFFGQRENIEKSNS